MRKRTSHVAQKLPYWYWWSVLKYGCNMYKVPQCIDRCCYYHQVQCRYVCCKANAKCNIHSSHDSLPNLILCFHINILWFYVLYVAATIFHKFKIMVSLLQSDTLSLSTLYNSPCQIKVTLKSSTAAGHHVITFSHWATSLPHPCLFLF